MSNFDLLSLINRNNKRLRRTDQDMGHYLLMPKQQLTPLRLLLVSRRLLLALLHCPAYLRVVEESDLSKLICKHQSSHLPAPNGGLQRAQTCDLLPILKLMQQLPL